MTGTSATGSSIDPGSVDDVDMTTTLSPASREAAITKLLGQFALVETAAAEGKCSLSRS